MKKTLFFFFVATILVFSSCIKIKNSYALITVIDTAGNNVGAGYTICMFDNDNFADDQMFSKITMITNQDGQAEFLLKPGEFVDDTYNIITRTFKVFEESTGTFDNPAILGSISANIEYGESTNLTITIGDSKNTVVTITVKEHNLNNAGYGYTIYMFDDPTFANAPQFATLQMTTDQDGKAEFILNSTEFANSSNDIITRYFKIFEGSLNEEIGSISANIEYGENTKLDMILD
ncbi:MAG: hypothetical protein JXL97_00795 [Bacteroidales bacterium]|nr:hypothetical protein [Bacteroidales bacterium]